jgi:hypothetical protein
LYCTGKRLAAYQVKNGVPRFHWKYVAWELLFLQICVVSVNKYVENCFWRVVNNAQK